MRVRCSQFEKEAQRALQDNHLQDALGKIDVRLNGMRDIAFSQLPDAEALRDRAHEIKRRAIERLDEYLETLEDRVRNLGGEVHWAETGREAVETVRDLADRYGAKTVVKGKSMISEEIALNEALSSHGLSVSETDLGEFIIQLAEEPPSHLVGPAIHKTKAQIASLFADKFGIEPMEDPRDMTLFAREMLRQRFLDADMGITGVNFAVAETGTIVLFENEGNIRMTTTLPKVHVALMSIEKVVPTLSDLCILMKLLARSCTGQKLSSYVSFIHGPGGFDEWDGAEAFHLVILDNGRSELIADDECREILYCIRCGACLNCCPVYLKAGGHAYGWVYSGPIGSILNPHLVQRRSAYPLPYASTLCGACAEKCPVKIDHPKILVALRRRYVEDRAWGNPVPSLEKGAFRLYAAVMRHHRLYGSLLYAARQGQSLFLRKRGASVPSPLNRWARNHRVRPLGRKGFRQLRRRCKKYEPT